MRRETEFQTIKITSKCVIIIFVTFLPLSHCFDTNNREQQGKRFWTQWQRAVRKLIGSQFFKNIVSICIFVQNVWAVSHFRRIYQLEVVLQWELYLNSVDNLGHAGVNNCCLEAYQKSPVIMCTGWQHFANCPRLSTNVKRKSLIDRQITLSYHKRGAEDMCTSFLMLENFL